MPNIKNQIEIQNITKSFRGNVILNNISLEIKQGTVTGLIGRNGSGKTVLMKCICGLISPDSGSVFIRGKQVGKDIDIPDNIGVIIEAPGFLPNFSAYQNLMQLAKIRRKIGKAEVRAAIERVGLNPDDKKHVGKYSLGMRQRLGLAQAIMENPELLILDEPMNGLDKDGVKDMRQYLLDLKAQGKTILIASHSAEDIDVLCDTVCEMDKGVLKTVR